MKPFFARKPNRARREEASSTKAATAPPHSAGPATDKAAGPDAEAQAAEGGSAMSLTAHLAELRTRVLRCVIGIFVCFIGVFSFAPYIRGVMETTLKAALPSGGLIAFADITEPFMVDMHLAFVLAFFVSSPYIFYQIWAFIAPGLYESERRHVVPAAFCSALFFIAGGTFCYLVVIPFTYTFFIGYGNGEATPVIMLANMYRYALRLMLAFGVMFEMPLFSFFLAKLGIVTAARLRAWRKYAILANFIIAALITPPEVLSQLLLAGPLVLLYEISIMVAGFAGKDSGEPEAARPA